MTERFNFKSKLCSHVLQDLNERIQKKHEMLQPLSCDTDPVRTKITPGNKQTADPAGSGDLRTPLCSRFRLNPAKNYSRAGQLTHTMPHIAGPYFRPIMLQYLARRPCC